MIAYLRILALGALSWLAVACTPVSFFFSENPSERFGNIWMTVQSIVLINDQGLPVFIYGNPDGEVININNAEEVGELFNLRSIPEGTYTHLQVTFANDVTVTDEEGEQTGMDLGGEGMSKSFTIPCVHIVEKDQPSAIVIEFDLEAVTVSGDELSVEPGMGCLNSNGAAGLAKNSARWRGTVTEILDEDSFVLGAQFWHRDVEVIVHLNEEGAVFDEITDASSSDTSLLAVDDRVRVFGGFDFTTFTLDALSVSIKSPEEDEDDDDSGGDDDPAGDDEPNDDDPADDDDGNGGDDDGDNGSDDGAGGRGNGASVELEGEVVSFDGSALVISVSDADFVPPSDEIEIADISNARFQRGSLEILEAGQMVELRGSWDGTVFSARFVNIEGARPGQSDVEGPPQKLRGTIDSVDGTLVTISVDRIQGYDGTPPEMVTIDLAETYLARGREECLLPGTMLDASGSYDGASFDATRVALKGNCGRGGGPDDDDPDDDGPDDDDIRPDPDLDPDPDPDPDPVPDPT